MPAAARNKAAGFALHLLTLRILHVAALCWWLGAAGQALAQASGTDAACGNAQSTAAMRACENERFKRADAGMNAAYRSLATRLDQGGQAKLRAAQQAWIRFREAEASYQADAERGGTLAPLVATVVRADLTEARRRDLEKAAGALK